MVRLPARAEASDGGTRPTEDRGWTRGPCRRAPEALRVDLGAPRDRSGDPAWEHLWAAGTQRRGQDHGGADPGHPAAPRRRDRKSTRLNSSHQIISYAVF